MYEKIVGNRSTTDPVDNNVDASISITKNQLRTRSHHVVVFIKVNPVVFGDRKLLMQKQDFNAPPHLQACSGEASFAVFLVLVYIAYRIYLWGRECAKPKVRMVRYVVYNDSHTAVTINNYPIIKSGTSAVLDIPEGDEILVDRIPLTRAFPTIIRGGKRVAVRLCKGNKIRVISDPFDTLTIETLENYTLIGVEYGTIERYYNNETGEGIRYLITPTGEEIHFRTATKGVLRDGYRWEITKRSSAMDATLTITPPIESV